MNKGVGLVVTTPAGKEGQGGRHGQMYFRDGGCPRRAVRVQEKQRCKEERRKSGVKNYSNNVLGDLSAN